MNDSNASGEFSLIPVQPAEARQVTYSLEIAATLGGVHPDMLRFYHQRGLIVARSVPPGAEPIFDDNSLFELRRIEHYRRHHGMSHEALRLLSHLAREVERLETELRALRGP